jgi:hypothetical protein
MNWPWSRIGGRLFLWSPQSNARLAASSAAGRQETKLILKSNQFADLYQRQSSGKILGIIESKFDASFPVLSRYPHSSFCPTGNNLFDCSSPVDFFFSDCTFVTLRLVLGH